MLQGPHGFTIFLNLGFAKVILFICFKFRVFKVYKLLCFHVNVECDGLQTQKTRFECAVCNKKFPRGYSLKRHILLLHTRETKYHCTMCPMGFSHTYNRLRHMRKAHSNSQLKTAPKHVVDRYR